MTRTSEKFNFLYLNVLRLIPFLLFFAQLSFSQNVDYAELGNPIDGKIKVATIDGCTTGQNWNQCVGHFIKFKFSRPVGTGTNQFNIIISHSLKKIIFKFSNVSNIVELNTFRLDREDRVDKIYSVRWEEYDFCKLVKLFQNAESVYVRAVMDNDNFRDFDIKLSGSKKALDYVLLEDIVPGYCRHYCDSFDSDGNWNNLDGRVNCNDYN